MIKNQHVKPEIFVGLNIDKGVSLESILNVVCKLTGVTKEEATGKSRFNKIPYCRQLYCYIAYHCNTRIKTANQANRKSLHQIGAFINCDHSTVLASKNKIQNQLGIYDDVTQDIKIIQDAVMIPNIQFNTNVVDSSTVGYYNTPERISEL